MMIITPSTLHHYRRRVIIFIHIFTIHIITINISNTYNISSIRSAYFSSSPSMLIETTGLSRGDIFGGTNHIFNYGNLDVGCSRMHGFIDYLLALWLRPIAKYLTTYPVLLVLMMSCMFVGTCLIEIKTKTKNTPQSLESITIVIPSS